MLAPLAATPPVRRVRPRRPPRGSHQPRPSQPAPASLSQPATPIPCVPSCLRLPTLPYPTLPTLASYIAALPVRVVVAPGLGSHTLQRSLRPALSSLQARCISQPASRPPATPAARRCDSHSPSAPLCRPAGHVHDRLRACTTRRPPTSAPARSLRLLPPTHHPSNLLALRANENAERSLLAA